MAGRRQDLETHLIAKDDASKVIDKVAGELDDLEKRDTTIDLTAEDHASDEVKSLSQLLAGLSDEDKTVVLNAKVSDAERNIDRILRSLRDVDKMDQKEIDVRVEMLGDARAELDRIQTELRDIDGTTADATVDVQTRGLDKLGETMGALPGQLGSIASALGPGGTIVGGVGALAAGMAAAADHAAEVAVSARTMSELTGDSVEDVSRLQAVWQTTGADVNDLNDIVLQMVGVLQSSPDLAAQLGINLKDGATGGERFVQVMEKLRDHTGTASEKAVLMSQLLGEEGARQGAKLLAVVDDIAASMEGVPEGLVISDQDVDQALKMKTEIAEMNAEFQAITLELGQSILPLMTQFADITGWIARQLPVGKGETLFGFGKRDEDAIDGIEGSIGEIEKHYTKIGDSSFRLAADMGTAAAGWKASAADAETVSAHVRFQALVASERSKKVQSETRQYLEAARDRKLAELEVAGAQQETIDNFAQMVEGIAAYNDAVAGTEWGAAEIEGAITGMDKFAQAHFGLAEIAKSSADAEQALADSVKENGASFDFSTEAGLKNLDAIEGVSEAVGVKLAAAYDDADGNQRKFQRSAKAIADETLARLREEMGLSQEETDALAEALGLMPEDIATRYELSGTEEAQLKLDLLSTSIDDLPDNVETKVTQKIIAGDYQGALRIIQKYYDDNPATLPVKPVIGSYVYPPGLIPSGSSAGPGTLSAGPMAAGVTPMAGPTLPTLMLPVAAPRGQAQTIIQNITLEAAVIGAPHDVARAVEEAMRRTARLQPVRP